MLKLPGTYINNYVLLSNKYGAPFLKKNVGTQACYPAQANTNPILFLPPFLHVFFFVIFPLSPFQITTATPTGLSVLCYCSGTNVVNL